VSERLRARQPPRKKREKGKGQEEGKRIIPCLAPVFLSKPGISHLSSRSPSVPSNSDCRHSRLFSLAAGTLACCCLPAYLPPYHPSPTVNFVAFLSHNYLTCDHQISHPISPRLHSFAVLRASKLLRFAIRCLARLPRPSPTQL
jgi:hypothetical protein